MTYQPTGHENRQGEIAMGTTPGLTTATATTAKYAAEAFAEAINRDGAEVSAEDIEALAAVVRGILTSTQEVLHVLERDAPNAATADELRDTRYTLEDASTILTGIYPARDGNGFSRIGTIDQIEALAPGRELVVGGAVYRVAREAGRIVVTTATGDDAMSPLLFIARHTRNGILLRD